MKKLDVVFIISFAMVFFLLSLCSCTIALGAENGVADLTDTGADGVKMPICNCSR